MHVKEIHCKTILSKTRLKDLDYSINPYVGCGHGCKYCYSQLISRKFSKNNVGWGDYCNPKVNAAEILEKELKNASCGRIVFSSITDAYQPIEAKYEITLQCLKTLLPYEKEFSLSILTKSPLVLRDLPLFKKFSSISVGFSISTDEEETRLVFEPNAPSLKERIDALAVLKKEGISTYAFVAPMLPLNPQKIAEMLCEKVDAVLIDDLNYSFLVKDLIDSRNFQNFFTQENQENTKKELLEAFSSKGVPCTILP